MKLLPAIVLPLLIPFTTAIPAHASGCPNVEVVFARGTGEPAGVGEVGQAFVDAVKPASTYAVDYPASMDFRNSTMAGVADAANHIEAVVARCPRTSIVLSGYSAGAAVASFVTSDVVPDGIDTDLKPLTDQQASHIKAVVLFGDPDQNFTNMIGVPPAIVGARFANRTDALCADGDPICSGTGDFANHCLYASNGMTADAARFVRNHL